jgi:hypothetical protein
VTSMKKKQRVGMAVTVPANTKNRRIQTRVDWRGGVSVVDDEVSAECKGQIHHRIWDNLRISTDNVAV